MIKKNSGKGYILEVDVDYPSKLHKLDSDMPFLCDCNWTRTRNHLVHKRTLNHLAKLA